MLRYFPHTKQSKTMKSEIFCDDDDNDYDDVGFALAKIIGGTIIL
jgi:hypothetical protein